MWRELLPPITAQSNDGKRAGVGFASKPFLDRSPSYSPDQKVDNQAASRNYLRPADAEPVAQMQSLRLDLEKLLERSEPLSRAGLIFDASQFLPCVLLNCRQIDLHLSCTPLALEQAAFHKRLNLPGSARSPYLLIFRLRRAIFNDLVIGS
jgi:hypothetical protein